MNEAINALAGIFTGKGGTLKLAIVTSIFGAIIYEFLNSGYNLTASSSDGTAISLTPSINKATIGQPNTDATTCDDTLSASEDIGLNS